MMAIQSEMSERAIELLQLPEDQPCLILDIGCGSGLSGECLDEQGHFWIGMDISKSMLGKIVTLQVVCLEKKNQFSMKMWLESEEWKVTLSIVIWETAFHSRLEPLMVPSVSVLCSGFATLTKDTTNLPKG